MCGRRREERQRAELRAAVEAEVVIVDVARRRERVHVEGRAAVAADDAEPRRLGERRVDAGEEAPDGAVDARRVAVTRSLAPGTIGLRPHRGVVTRRERRGLLAEARLTDEPLANAGPDRLAQIARLLLHHRGGRGVGRTRQGIERRWRLRAGELDHGRVDRVGDRQVLDRRGRRLLVRRVGGVRERRGVPPDRQIDVVGVIAEHGSRKA